MELDVANAALELSVRFPADASDEATAIFLKTHCELTNNINEHKQKINEHKQKVSEALIKVVDNALDSFNSTNNGCYGAASFMRRTIKNQDTPWVNLVGSSNGTVRMVRYDVTEAYFNHLHPGEPFAIVYSDMHSVARGNEYLAGVRAHLRDIYKASGSTAINDIEAFIAVYLTHDARYNPSVRAALVQRENRNYQYVIWQ